MGVYLRPQQYATQGPCPDGFHIPTKDDWSGLRTVMVSLSTNFQRGDYWRDYLHLPLSGYRKNSDADTNYQGSQGYYWSSSYYTTEGFAWEADFNSSQSVNTGNTGRCTEGRTIRPFKNEFETPTSSWTVIYGTLGSAGIFRNQTDGIISVTSDGTSGYTISDKNLGATNVYSYGNTLSESNCGKYYQRGNNYGFAWSGSLTTSSIKVDASAYGPGNYYESSTFICVSRYPYSWDSSNNQNLWGGVDGNVTVQHELLNAYIGIPFPESITLDKSSITLNTVGQTEQLTATIEPEVSDHSVTWTSSDTTVATVSSSGLVTCVTPGDATITATTVNGLTATCGVSNGWQPGANTLLYCPLKTDLKDTINGITPTNSGVTITTDSGISCAYSNDNYAIYVLDMPNDKTISIWCKPNFDNSWMILWDFDKSNSTSPSSGPSPYPKNFLTNGISNTGYWFMHNAAADGISSILQTNAWHNIVVIQSGGNVYQYVDGSLTYTGTSWMNEFTAKRLQLFTRDNSGQRWKGYANELIVENKVRTAQEISDYYNQTKGNYGIS